MNVMPLIHWRRPASGVEAQAGYLAAQIVLVEPGAKHLSQCQKFHFGDVRREGETEDQQKRRLAYLLLAAMAEEAGPA